MQQQQHFWFIGDENEIDWRLDERTRTIGRNGIAQARATLASCQPALREQEVMATAA